MKKPKAKERILETAAELFAERGYGSVGINEIIEKSETAKASFYHHFPSKENLCITWLIETHARSEIRHQAILDSPASAADKIIEYFDGLKEWMKQKEFRGCPFTNTTAGLDKESLEIAEQVEIHKLSIRAFLIELAKEVVSSGASAEKFGTLLFLLYSGATTEAQNLKSDWPIDAAIESVKELIDRESAQASL